MKLRTWNKPARPSVASRRVRAESIAADALVLAIGLACTFTVHLVGQIPLSEILIAASLPLMIVARGSRMIRPKLVLICVLLSLWLGNQVITDMWRRTPEIDWIRGDANLIFFGLDLLALAMLIPGNMRRQVLFLAGYSVGALLSARFQPSELSLDEPWKFGYAMGANVLVALAACYFFARRQYVRTGILLSAIIAVNLVENFRSPVMDYLITIALVLPVIPRRVGRLTFSPRRGSMAYILFIVVLGLAGASSALMLVKFATERGLLKEEAVQKNQEQSQSAGGLLLGGRPEILASSRAVLDSPILGHGAWARDFKYIEMLADIQARWGMQVDLEENEEFQQGLIPSHSHLMGAWVQAGVFGGVFWLYMFWLAMKGLIRLSVARPPLAPVLAFLLASFLFDILFSPFGSTRRIADSFLIIVVLDMLLPVMVQNSNPTRVWRRHPQGNRMPSFAA